MAETTYWAQCLDCGWKGQETLLKAQACPDCDGRCADIPEPSQADLLREAEALYLKRYGCALMNSLPSGRAQ